MIGERCIGTGERPYIIAEIGVNHDGDANRAGELVDAAVAAGATAVKFQYFRAERLLGSAARLATYQRDTGAASPTALLEPLELGLDTMANLVDRAHRSGAHALLTLFSLEDIDAANALPWDAWKVASPDVVNRPLLEGLAGTSRPLIVSTGAAHEDEVRRAVAWLDGHPLALLQCVSSYPTPDADARLGAIRALAAFAPGPVGYSDHTTALDTGALAVAAGAAILEKHLTWDTGAAGPDHAASIDARDFTTYVAEAERAWRMLGDDRKTTGPSEDDVRVVSRQSLTTTRSLPEGSTLERHDLTVRRPGTGIPAAELDQTIGRRLARSVDAGATLCAEDLA